MASKNKTKAFVVPEASASTGLPAWQRIDIYLSSEYDTKDREWRDANNDKAAYMNDEENRARAAEALGIKAE